MKIETEKFYLFDLIIFTTKHCQIEFTFWPVAYWFWQKRGSWGFERSAESTEIITPYIHIEIK